MALIKANTQCGRTGCLGFAVPVVMAGAVAARAATGGSAGIVDARYATNLLPLGDDGAKVLRLLRGFVCLLFG